MKSIIDTKSITLVKSSVWFFPGSFQLFYQLLSLSGLIFAMVNFCLLHFAMIYFRRWLVFSIRFWSIFRNRLVNLRSFCRIIFCKLINMVIFIFPLIPDLRLVSFHKPGLLRFFTTFVIKNGPLVLFWAIIYFGNFFFYFYRMYLLIYLVHYLNSVNPRHDGRHLYVSIYKKPSVDSMFLWYFWIFSSGS